MSISKQEQLTVGELFSRLKLDRPASVEFRNVSNGMQLAVMHSDSPAMELFKNQLVEDWFGTNDTMNGCIYVSLYWEVK